MGVSRRSGLFGLLRDLQAVSVLWMTDRGRLVNPWVELEINPWFNPDADDGRALQADHGGHDNY
jgi:hypothetical protein